MNKRYFLIILLVTCICKYSSAQILCINCYNQNDSISYNVTNLLLNGGFENTTCVPGTSTTNFCPNASNYSCDIFNWTCTDGGTMTYTTPFNVNSALSFIPEGNLCVYFGNYLCKSCSNVFGDTSCISQILCSTTPPPTGYPVSGSSYGSNAGVSLAQTVSGLIVGNTYVLEFWVGGESNNFGSYPSEGLFEIDIGFGKSFLRNHETPLIGGIGKRYVIQFNAIATSHIIKFTNWGHICPTCTELVLDNARLYTLAELDSSVAHCFGTGTNEIYENISVNLYPNPVTDKLNISNSSNEISEIILYDIALRKLMQQQFRNSVSLNTEQLTRGLYLYEVRDKNGLCKKGKVVKH